MRSPEGFERKDIQKFLDSIGAVHFHIVNRGFGASGAPDLISCLPLTCACGQRYGAFAGIETKRYGKEPTFRQYENLGKIEKSNGLTFWGTAERVIPILQRKHFRA